MFGTCVAETILASVHVRTQQQAGHMDASDLVKLSRNILRVGGRPHKGFEPTTLLFAMGYRAEFNEFIFDQRKLSCPACEVETRRDKAPHS